MDSKVSIWCSTLLIDTCSKIAANLCDSSLQLAIPARDARIKALVGQHE